MVRLAAAAIPQTSQPAKDLRSFAPARRHHSLRHADCLHQDRCRGCGIERAARRNGIVTSMPTDRIFRLRQDSPRPLRDDTPAGFRSVCIVPNGRLSAGPNAPLGGRIYGLLRDHKSKKLRPHRLPRHALAAMTRAWAFGPQLPSPDLRGQLTAAAELTELRTEHTVPNSFSRQRLAIYAVLCFVQHEIRKAVHRSAFHSLVHEACSLASSKRTQGFRPNAAGCAAWCSQSKSSAVRLGLAPMNIGLRGSLALGPNAGGLIQGPSPGQLLRH
jgi:hypothetical protein